MRSSMPDIYVMSDWISNGLVVGLGTLALGYGLMALAVFLLSRKDR